LGGIYPALIYSLSIIYTQLLSPILPDITWTVESLIFTIIPLIGIIFIDEFFPNRLNRFFKVFKPADHKSGRSTWLLFTLILSIILIWFVNGFFPAHPRVIVSSSMVPSLNRGDIVIVKDIYVNRINIGDIVEYISRDDRVIIHRVINKLDYSDFKVFITKGDANSGDDGYIYPIQIRGVVIGVIPYLGMLSIYLKDAVAVGIKYISTLSGLEHMAMLIIVLLLIFVIILLKKWRLL